MLTKLIIFLQLLSFDIYAGLWFVHCHVEDHLMWGLSMAFEVENGPTPETMLPPPPPDLPTQC